MLTPPKIQKLVGDAPLPGAACAAGIWFHTGGRDLPVGSDSIKGAARRAVPRWPTILATTEKHPPSFSIFVLPIILKATGGHVKIYSQLRGRVSWNFWGAPALTSEKRKRGGAQRRLPGCQKSPRTFPTACKNAVTFPPFNGGKVLAALAERLAMQGVQGIRSHSRRAAAPSSSPALTQVNLILHRFFDKLKGGAQRRLHRFHVIRIMPWLPGGK